MKYRGLLTVFLFFSFPALADTLYQAEVGGYSTGVGVGMSGGVSTANPYLDQTNINYRGYTSNPYSGIPYDNFNYPYSSGCCGCNICNNCDTSYANRCCR